MNSSSRVSSWCFEFLWSKHFRKDPRWSNLGPKFNLWPFFEKLVELEVKTSFNANYFGSWHFLAAEIAQTNSC